MKDDLGKERIELIPIEPLFDIAKVFEFGAEKYDKDSWKTDIYYSRVYASIQRHLMKWYSRQDKDPESNLNHLSHAATQIMILLYYVRYFSHMDDRPERPNVDI